MDEKHDKKFNFYYKNVKDIYDKLKLNRIKIIQKHNKNDVKQYNKDVNELTIKINNDCNELIQGIQEIEEKMYDVSNSDKLKLKKNKEILTSIIDRIQKLKEVKLKIDDEDFDKNIEEEKTEQIKEKNLFLKHDFFVDENFSIDKNYLFEGNNHYVFEDKTLNLLLKVGDINGLLEYVDDIKQIVLYELNNNSIKLQLSAYFYFETGDGLKQNVQTTKNLIVLTEENLDEKIYELLNELVEVIINFSQKGSVNNFIGIECLMVKTYKYDTLHYGIYIPTPGYLKKKNLINIKNYDDRCFYYLMMYWFNKDDEIFKKSKDYSRLNLYEKLPIIPHFKNIEFPVSLKDIKIFEKNNDVSINIFSENVSKNKYIKYFEKICDNVELKNDFLNFLNEKYKINNQIFKELKKLNNYELY